MAMLGKTAVMHYTGNAAALGTACGKYFGVSCMVIINAGSSDILEGH